MNSDKDATSGDSLNQIAQVLQSNLPELDVLRAVTLDNLQFLRTAVCGKPVDVRVQKLQTTPDPPAALALCVPTL